MLIDFCAVRGIRFTYKYINYRFGGAESYMRKNGTKRDAGKRIAGAIICAGILLLAVACGRANESDPDVVNVIPEPISETPVLAPEITEDPTPSAEPAVAPRGPRLYCLSFGLGWPGSFAVGHTGLLHADDWPYSQEVFGGR